MSTNGLLIDSIPDALFILSYDETTDTHQVVDVNESTCNLLGYERDELLKLTIQDIDDPASPVGPPDMFERMRSGAPVVFERIHRRRDGSTLPVEVHARVGEIRGRQVIISVVRDIARRKAMEQDLRRFEAAIRQTEDAVVITEAPEGRKPHVLFANQAFTKITGYTLREALEQDITILQLPGTNSGNNDEVRALHAATHNRKPFQGITHSYRKDGAPITLHWSISPIVGAQGDVTNFAAVIRDVTEQERQMQRLQEMNETIEQQRSRLNDVLDSMQDALVSISLEDRSVLYVSASYEQVMGYPIERFMQDPEFFKQVVHPDDLAMTLEKRHRSGRREWPISSIASFCPMARSAGCTGVRGCSTTARGGQWASTTVRATLRGKKGRRQPGAPARKCIDPWWKARIRQSR
ncbi:MAG: PAS domain S-box protein [Caldilineaceae bacterium]